MFDTPIIKNVTKLRDITKKTLLYKTSKHIKRHKKAYKNDNSEKKHRLGKLFLATESAVHATTEVKF